MGLNEILIESIVKVNRNDEFKNSINCHAAFSETGGIWKMKVKHIRRTLRNDVP